MGTKVKDIIEFDGTAVKEVGAIKYGKCKNGHPLSKVDCPLINDYDYVTSLCSKISSYFQMNKTKNALDLSKNFCGTIGYSHIGDVDVMAIAKILEMNPTITELNLCTPCSKT